MTGDIFSERVFERLDEHPDQDAYMAQLTQLYRSAEEHIERFRVAQRRRDRALRFGDHAAVEVEHSTMAALLYEAMDTVYLVVQLFDADRLRLESSLDGKGIRGEDASFVASLLDRLENISRRILAYEREENLTLDFRHPVDEREGITYTTRKHWQDIVPGSLEKSFFAYFIRARDAIGKRLNQVPRFWHQQTLAQALARSRRRALSRVLARLREAPLPETRLVEKIEREAASDETSLWVGQAIADWVRKPI